jgi:hypothetical protein
MSLWLSLFTALILPFVVFDFFGIRNILRARRCSLGSPAARDARSSAFLAQAFRCLGRGFVAFGDHTADLYWDATGEQDIDPDLQEKSALF